MYKRRTTMVVAYLSFVEDLQAIDIDGFSLGCGIYKVPGTAGCLGQSIAIERI